MSNLPVPIRGSIIYEDDLLYVCLANFPITVGHTVVVWKQQLDDIHLLERVDYEHLMDIVDQTRNALIDSLGVEKVYLMYLDEIKHVHWHLVPRYNEQGVNILTHQPKLLSDLSIVPLIKQSWHKLR